MISVHYALDTLVGYVPLIKDYGDALAWVNECPDSKIAQETLDDIQEEINDMKTDLDSICCDRYFVEYPNEFYRSLPNEVLDTIYSAVYACSVWSEDMSEILSLAEEICDNARDC